MADERDEIRARIDLVDLVSERVALKRAGKQFKGLCPFHEDRNPSFTVDPTTGRYKCWSCGENGDIFTWVMKTEHVEFVDALKDLAARAGVKLRAGASTGQASERESNRNAMDTALRFFREQLERSTAATQYCLNRGLGAEIVESWQIGYAPDTGDALAVLLKKLGFSLAQAKSLFLVEQDASGGYYDRFRGRLMFPIHDEKGDLVAFGGRLLGDGLPKYINSSDTPLYKKSRVLYGMNRSRDVFSKSRKAVLVEGYLDVIACHRSGVAEAVASLGTALSEDHAKLLSRWVDGVTILYDSDAAGQKAADRAIDIFRSANLAVRVALLEPGEDPDTLFRSKGAEAVKAAATKGGTATAFRVGLVERSLSPGDNAFWEQAVAVLAAAPQDMEVEKHILRLSPLYPGLKDVRAAQERLRRMITQARGGEGTREPVRERREAKAEYRPLEEKLTSPEFVLFRSLLDPSLSATAWERIALRPVPFETGQSEQLCASVAAAFPAEPPVGPCSQWLHLVEPEENAQLLSDLLLDFRSENLTLERLNDSIEKLELRAKTRDLRRSRQGELSPEEREQHLSELRELNPDRRKRTSGAANDPFA